MNKKKDEEEDLLLLSDVRLLRHQMKAMPIMIIAPTTPPTTPPIRPPLVEDGTGSEDSALSLEVGLAEVSAASAEDGAEVVEVKVVSVAMEVLWAVEDEVLDEDVVLLPPLPSPP